MATQLCNRVALAAQGTLVALAMVVHLVLLCGCGRAIADRAHAPRPKIFITGSSTLAPLVSKMAQRFQQRQPDVQIDVQSGGSAQGIMDVRTGLADIGMVSRQLRPDDGPLVAFPIARDGIALIVHRSNSVTELSVDQVRSIYLGHIRNWHQLGGTSGPITVVHKAEGRATFELFVQFFSLDPRRVRCDVVVGENEQAILTVAANPGALGYVSIGTAEADERRGIPIRRLPLNGISAERQHVADGSYPLSRTLYLVCAEQPQGIVGQFVRWAQSPAVRDLVEEASFVAIAE